MYNNWVREWLQYNTLLGRYTAFCSLVSYAHESSEPQTLTEQRKRTLCGTTITKEMIMQKIQGRCLCGAVRYRSDVAPLLTAICNCKNCQRQTGTAFSILVAVPK